MIFKCKMCGATLDIEKDKNIVECEYCGTKQTVPVIKTKEIEDLYDKANYFFHNNEYDKAADIYENISTENPYDPESYFMLALCKYGIEYVEDPKTKKRIPTLHRLHYESITNDINFKKALKNADSSQKIIYEQEAKYIDEVRNKILDISKKEKPYDVFICYKESDEKGQRTEDSVLAMDIYNELAKEGLKVFFSKVTLEDKLGIDYEPYIFAALNSAKVMVVVGTKPEYINSPWVRNEWTRFLDRINSYKSGKKNTEQCYIVPAYKDMSPYALPNEFNSVQAQDMSKVGAVQDLVHGVKKLVNKTGEGNKIESISNKKYSKLVLIGVVAALIIGVILVLNLAINKISIGNMTYFTNKNYDEVVIEGISNFGLSEISKLKKIKSIQNLCFNDCSLDNLDFVYELSNVKGLKFDGKTKILDFGLKNVCENIVSFNYDYGSSSLVWDDLNFITKLPNLNNICVPICDDLLVLSDCKKLETIELRSQKNTTIDNFQWCKGLENVKNVKIKTGNQVLKYVGNDYFNGIENLVNLEELYIAGKIGSEGTEVLQQIDLENISKLRNLKNLTISFSGVGNVANQNSNITLKCLNGMKNLRSLNINSANYFELQDLSLSELREIKLSNKRGDIIQDDLTCLCECKNLESIYLYVESNQRSVYDNNHNVHYTTWHKKLGDKAREFSLKGIEKLKKLKVLSLKTGISGNLTILDEEIAKNNISLEYTKDGGFNN